MPHDLLDQFMPTVAKMTVIVLIGYLTSRTEIITAHQLGGMSKFVGVFCLPAMLFRTLVSRVDEPPSRGSYMTVS
jgi:predicted permease